MGGRAWQRVVPSTPLSKRAGFELAPPGRAGGESHPAGQGRPGRPHEALDSTAPSQGHVGLGPSGEDWAELAVTLPGCPRGAQYVPGGAGCQGWRAAAMKP